MLAVRECGVPNYTVFSLGRAAFRNIAKVRPARGESVQTAVPVNATA